MNFLLCPTSGLAFSTKVSQLLDVALGQFSALLCNAPFPQVPLVVAVLCAELSGGQALPEPLLHYSFIQLPPLGGRELCIPALLGLCSSSSGAGGKEGVKGASTEVPGSLEML